MSSFYPKKRDNLLDLALKYSKKKEWYSGESVRLWGDKKRGAFLKNESGFVTLNLVHYSPNITIFWLNLKAGKWQKMPDVKS